MPGYRDKVMRDVMRWAERGLIAPDAVEAIRADLAARRSGFNLPQALALLGGILLVLAALTFVGANWTEIPRLVRLLLLGAALVVSYAAAVRFYLSDHSAFGQVALLVGCGVYGASIMLVAQMYHVSGNPVDAVLAWALGTTLAAAAFRAPAVWVLAFALFALWSLWIVRDTEAVHWAYLAVLAGMAGLAWWMPFAAARYLVALAVCAWVLLLSPLEGAYEGQYVTLAIGLVIAAAGAAAMFLRDGVPESVRLLAPVTMLSGYVIAFGALFVLQFLDESQLSAFIVLAVFTIALSIGVLVIGRARDHAPTLWLAYIGFSVEVIGIYFQTVGTLLNTSVFFLTVGIVVIGLAWLALKLTRRAEART